MAVAENVVLAVDEARKNVPATLLKLKRYFDLTDKAIAALSGLPRSTVNTRITGATPCSATDLAAFAAVFGVPVGVLYLEPDQALRWVLDHPDAQMRGILSNPRHATTARAA